MPSILPRQQKILASVLAGLGVGLIAVSISGSSEAQSNCVRRADGTILLPLIAPIVSSDSASERADFSSAGVATKEQQQVRLNSAQIVLKQAKVAVALSQVQLAQARINLVEFQAKHNSAKILSAQGKVSRQQAALVVAAYKLAQLQHGFASIGLQESQAQLVAANTKVSKLGGKANTQAEM